MCYEPGYAHLSKSEQREERARIHAHHVTLRENLNAGLPGAQEAYDAHLNQHRRDRRFSDHSFDYGDERAKSILAQRAAELRVTMRKVAREVELQPDPAVRAAARERRIAARAARREQARTLVSVEEFLRVNQPAAVVS